MFIFEDVTSTASEDSDMTMARRSRAGARTSIPDSSLPQFRKRRSVQARSSKNKMLDPIVLHNQSVLGVQDMFLGDFEERRQFGVADIMSTLGIIV